MGEKHIQIRGDRSFEDPQQRLKLETSIQKGIQERWDEVMQLGLAAVARLIANGVISAADFIPLGAGEVPGWAADLTKLVAKIPGFNKADFLTPDVSTKVAVGSEILFEPMTGGAAPTHIIETALQAKADLQAGRFGVARDTLAYLLTGNEEALNRLQERANAHQDDIIDETPEESDSERAAITGPVAQEKRTLSVRDILTQIKAYREAKNRGDFNG